MISPQSIHELIRRNHYREAYTQALALETEIGSCSINFIKARILSNLTIIFYLLLGNTGLKLGRLLLNMGLPSSQIKWVHSNAILWGIYWQDMRKALGYNLSNIIKSENESDFLLSVYFAFYTEAFLGNIFALRAMKKLVLSERVSKSGLKKNLLVWLGVSYQMNSDVKGCLDAHDLFNKSSNPDHFQLLISKASILNMSISEMGPLDAEAALEECFKVSCSLNNSRNHIQLYGAKCILMALEGNHQSARSFYEKAKLAAEVNDNTLDWIIFSRLSSIYCLIVKDWTGFNRWHLEMKCKLNVYAPVSWYWKEYRRLKIVSLYERKVHRFFLSDFAQSIFYSLFSLNPTFLISEVKKLGAFVLTGRTGYWSDAVLLKFFSSTLKRNLDSSNNDKFKALILSLRSLMSNRLDVDLKSSIINLKDHVGADYILVEDNIPTLIKKASLELSSNLENNLKKEDENSYRFFIDNKGFFVAHKVELYPNVKPFAFGMLFKVLDVHSLESFDLISNLSAQYLAAIESVKSNAELLAHSKILSQKAEMAAQVSHDIRSPLTALNMAMHSFSGVSLEHRELIQNAIDRINDIANELLNKSKEVPSNVEILPLEQLKISPTNPIAATKIQPIVERVIAEKNLELINQKNLEIELDNHSTTEALVKLQPSDLARILSNLINNSVEALPDSRGKITVGLRSYRDMVSLTVNDNGKGIPSEILHKLGDQKITYNKTHSSSGSGLGLYHAKKTIQNFGGHLQIQSQENIGTLVEIRLPRV